MKNTVQALLLAVVVAVIPVTAKAITYDFSTLNGANVFGQHSVTVGSGASAVTASAYSTDGLGTFIPTDLWLRTSIPHDAGLGVCTLSERLSTPDCTSGGGDVNEISNQLYPSTGLFDSIQLEKAGGNWTSLVVSSLDSGGTNNAESGLLIWTDQENAAGQPVYSPSNVFGFSYNDFKPSDNGDLMSLDALSTAGFDGSAKYVLLAANPLNCVPDNNVPVSCNNDFLVWKASVAVPEPSTLALLGLGLAALLVTVRYRMPRKRN